MSRVGSAFQSTDKLYNWANFTMNKFRHTHNSLPYFELFTVSPQLLTLHPIVLPAASSQQPTANSQQPADSRHQTEDSRQ